MASEVIQLHLSNGASDASQNGHCKDSGDTTCTDCGEKIQGYDERIIKVPADLIKMPLGFSIDSGGSVTKLVYRSNKDYRNGERIEQVSGDAADEGLLRLVHVPKSALDSLPDFLLHHCDIMHQAICVTNQGDSNNNVKDKGDSNNNATDHGESSDNDADPGDRAFWYQTGVGVQHYMTELDSRLNIRTRLCSELSCLVKALMELSENNTRPGVAPVLRPQPVSLVGLDRSLCLVRSFLQMTAKYRAVADLIKEDITSPKEGFDIEAWGRKLCTSSAESLSEELSVRSIELPQMIVLIGSALVALILTEEGKTRFVDMNTAAGKTALGLGLAATGAKNFEELIAMASRGRRYAADLVLDELSNKEREPSDSDFYSAISDNTEMPVFLLGKLSEEKYKDSYTREDMAVGILKMFAHMFVKQSIACAQLWGQTSIVFAGSFLQNSLLRDLFEEKFHYESLIQPFYGKEMIKMSVMEHSGHLCALGTWLMNAQLHTSTLNDLSTQL